MKNQRAKSRLGPPLAPHSDGHVLLTMKQGEGMSTAVDGRVFVLWQDQDVRGVFAGMGLAVVEAFTNVSVLATGLRGWKLVGQGKPGNPSKSKT